MKFPAHPLWQGSLVLLLFLSACEKPKQHVSAEPQEAPAPEVAAAEVAAPAPAPAPSSPVTPAAPPLPEVPAPQSQRDPAPFRDPEPELSVARVGQKIVVSGALRSKIQVDRIHEALKRDFADHEIEGTPVVD